MASFEKRGSSVRAIVNFPDGKRTKTFSTLREAKVWAAKLEHEKKAGKVKSAHRRSAEDLFMAYLPVAEDTDSGKWNSLRLLSFCEDEIGAILLSDIEPLHVQQWIARRLLQVSSSTARREMALLSSAFSYGVSVCKWLSTNPCTGVKKPAKGPPRNRDLLTAAENRAIEISSGYSTSRPPQTLTERTGACFFLSIETGMRAGEILRVRPRDYNRKKRTVYVHALERGGRKGSRSGEIRSDRTVPLTERAMLILDQLLETMPTDQVPKPDLGMSMPPYIVGMTDSQRDALWRKIRDRSGVLDFKFHDAKHEAATRLARFCDVIALSHALGTKDLKLLRDTYYNNDAQKIATLLPSALSEHVTTKGASRKSQQKRPTRIPRRKAGASRRPLLSK